MIRRGRSDHDRIECQRVDAIKRRALNTESRSELGCTFGISIGDDHSLYCGVGDQILSPNLAHTAGSVDENFHEVNLIRRAT